MKTGLLVMLVAYCSSISLRNTHPDSEPQHQYWFTKDHPLQADDDSKWSYCDYKCLTLEKLNSNKDFVVIQFNPALK